MVLSGLSVDVGEAELMRFFSKLDPKTVRILMIFNAFWDPIEPLDVRFTCIYRSRTSFLRAT